MAEFVATRNTCFALISAIEDDFRSLIAATSEAIQKITDLLPTDVREVALKRRSNELRMDLISSTVQDADLLPYVDFADIAKVINSRLAPKLDRESNWLRKSAQTLLALTPTRNRVCHTRPLEAEDLPRTIDFANSLVGVDAPFLFPTVSNALSRLQNDPGFVLTLQIPTFWSIDNRRIHNNLPIPEFDDTGFLGRSADRMQVMRLLNSHYPVVTIVGEGGIGKTALALRCLYDMLEDSSCPYDAIVWVSMKTAALTPTGVRELADAITSTLGLLSEIVTQLGAPVVQNRAEEDLIEEIAEYLSLYRIIIAIDNLETISTGALRDLLCRVPSQSKILLTSRVGVGEFEARYPLQELDEKTSIALFRNFARLLSVTELAKNDEGNIKGFCRRLFNNPLLIKWFVASVGRGFDPTRLMSTLSNDFTSALSFCFDNLFDRFGTPERTVIDCLASARIPLSSTEIHYLCPALSSVDAEIALSALHNSSIVSRSKSNGEGFEYSLSESAQKFLSIKAPPSKIFFKAIQQRMRELRQILTKEAIKEHKYEYDPYFVRLGSSKDEMICATYLRRALDKLKQEDFLSARQAVSEAKRLTPSSSEAWRISALIEDREGDLYSAVDSYEQSIGLAPNSTIARYCYGIFLMNDMEDIESALAQFNAGEKLDPSAIPISTAKALALTRLGRFEEAAQIHDLLLPTISTRDRRWRLAGADQAADCYSRWAYRQWEMKEYDSAKELYEQSFSILLDAAERSDIDDKLLHRVGKVVNESLSKKELTVDGSFLEKVVSLIERISKLSTNVWIPINMDCGWALRNLEANEPYRKRLVALDQSNSNRDLVLQSASLSEASKTMDTQTDIKSGTIDNLAKDGKYGFIIDAGAHRWFFHAQFMRESGDWGLLKVGSQVLFRIGQNAKGLCAVDVCLKPMVS